MLIVFFKNQDPLHDKFQEEGTWAPPTPHSRTTKLQTTRALHISLSLSTPLNKQTSSVGKIKRSGFRKKNKLFTCGVCIVIVGQKAQGAARNLHYQTWVHVLTTYHQCYATSLCSSRLLSTETRHTLSSHTYSYRSTSPSVFFPRLFRSRSLRCCCW